MVYTYLVYGVRCGFRRSGCAAWCAGPKRLEPRLVCAIWCYGLGDGLRRWDSRPVVSGLRGTSSGWCGWDDAKASLIVN